MSSPAPFDGVYGSLEPILSRSGPLARADFEPGAGNLDTLKACRLLVVGAGGLGCELLKDLALMGFGHLEVIDMDTIDLSNLNRQFLFREKDVGRSKAEVASEFIHERVPHCTVVPHCARIQDMDEQFYSSFNIILCGLDSVAARRWLNAMVISLLEYDDGDGQLDYSTIRPLIDGGTEGLRGNARVILPGVTPCVECTLALYPTAEGYPLCTIASTPRLPEHCVEFVRLIGWQNDKPFGECEVDGDNSEHVKWIYDRAVERAERFGIAGVTYRLAHGVVKHIIPAVASTNAAVAAVCALEAFKLATNCGHIMDNYVNFAQTDGVFMGAVSLERRDDCLVCSRQRVKLEFNATDKLQQVLDYLMDNVKFQMRHPSITMPGRTLYMTSIASLAEKTKGNLEKTLYELGVRSGCEFVVTDETYVQPVRITVNIAAGEDD